MRRAELWILALGIVACRAVSERDPVLPIPATFPGFPLRSADDSVLAAAFFPSDHEQVLSVDLTERGFLPVAVRIGLQAEASKTIAVQAFEARLILQDGTALQSTEPERISGNDAVLQGRLAERALLPAELPPFDDARAGFLYFVLDPGMRVRGRYALVRAGSVYREVDLLDSLVLLRISSADGVREIHVGVRNAPWHPGGEEGPER